MIFIGFRIEDYQARIKELSSRAKAGNSYSNDCDIGETAYLETLILYIENYKSGKTSREKLIESQKRLEEKLARYYQHKEMFAQSVEINNRYSHILTQVEKSGCEICQKLVRIFDGREKHG